LPVGQQPRQLADQRQSILGYRPAVFAGSVLLQLNHDSGRSWFLHSLYARAREAEWELGTFATDKYRSSLTTSRNHYAA
jgi:hypothetical protein